MVRLGSPILGGKIPSVPMAQTISYSTIKQTMTNSTLYLQRLAIAENMGRGFARANIDGTVTVQNYWKVVM